MSVGGVFAFGDGAFSRFLDDHVKLGLWGRWFILVSSEFVLVAFCVVAAAAATAVAAAAAVVCVRNGLFWWVG